MTREGARIFIALVVALCALGIGALLLLPSTFNSKKNNVERQARIIIPQSSGERTDNAENIAELMALEDSMTAKIPLADGEVIVSVLNGNFDGGPMENQFIAYRNLQEIESPIYLTYIEYNERSRNYRRIWSAQTAATRPGTISLFTQDLLGDRSICVLLSGVNGLDEHTLTIFHLNEVQMNEATANMSMADNGRFSKIAELRIDGSITIREIERSQAYQMGYTRGQSFTIAAYGRDFESANILDQVELVYAYNEGNGLYEQTSITRIPGTQIEQRRVRELLGNSRAFEEFVTGLWYYMTPQGTIDKRQYIYFSPSSREIIFYADETQQVFTWQNSTTTRYGLYVSSQNISVTTLRRSIDIELESLESIKVRVFEDVRLKIGVNAPWDGSYKKAGQPENNQRKQETSTNTFIAALYDGPAGKVYFSPSGTYELYTANSIRQGRYAFFYLDDQELLELRSNELRSSELRSSEPRSTDHYPTETRSEGLSGFQRETYLVEGDNPVSQSQTAEPVTAPEQVAPLRKTLTLQRVRIGARGIERLHEGTMLLTLVSE